MYWELRETFKILSEIERIVLGGYRIGLVGGALKILEHIDPKMNITCVYFCK